MYRKILQDTRWPFWEKGRVIGEISNNQIIKYVYFSIARFIMNIKCWLTCSQKQQPMTLHLLFLL